MWRSVRLFVPKSKLSTPLLHPNGKLYSTSGRSNNITGKVIFGTIASIGLGFTGATVYGQYDPKFKQFLENTPYLNYIFKILKDDSAKLIITANDETERKRPVFPQTLKNKIDAHFLKFDPGPVFNDDEEDIFWRGANFAGLEKEKCLNVDEQKTAETKILTQKLKNDVRNLSEQDSGNPLIRDGKEFAQKCSEELQNSETDVAAAQKDSETDFESEHLLKKYEDELWKEREITLPNFLYEEDLYNDDKLLAEGDLYSLLSDAYLRIEQLQKEIVKQQVTEKIRIDEEIRNQSIEDERKTVSKLQTEMQRHLFNLESVVEDRVALARFNFEAELHQQLFRQAAVHANHLQEVLRAQELELERKHMLELEEKLLHQKNVLVSEYAENKARLKGIVEYLQTKNELEKLSKRTQALWLALKELNYKIISDKSENLNPLAKDIAALKIAVDADNDFINSVLSSIPSKAVNRGVVPYEILKKRFENVKRNCKKVALIDENNDSLYRYFWSYLLSFLIIDNVDALINSREQENKVAVDTSEWDNYDILSRISYCIKLDDLEQALRFANQLKGESRAVAKDWINEVKIFLETELAIKALLAYATAVNVQAYH